MGKFFKVILTILICGGTIAASFGIMIWMVEMTGWYIFTYGLIVAIVRAEFVAIWGQGLIKTIKTEKKERHRYRRSTIYW